MEEQLPYAQSFRDLLAYQKARELSQAIFEVSKEFPKEEMYLFCGNPSKYIRETAPEYFTRSDL